MSPGLLAGVIAVLLATSAGAQRKPDGPIPAAAVVAVVIWLIVGPWFVAELAYLIAALAAGELADALVALGYVLATGIVLFPWPITRAILIPLGQVKLAWALTRLSFWIGRRDLRGVAVLAASWAGLRRGHAGPALDAELIAWIERRRDASPRGEVRWKLGGAAVVATGLLAENCGDRASARRLLDSALELAAPTRARVTIEAAALWLCAEAIERGAWRELGRIVGKTPIATRRLRLIRSVAARVAEAEVDRVSDARLWWEWLIAPGRRANLELVRRGLAAPNSASGPTARERDRVGSIAVPEGADPLTVALTLHAATLASPPDELDRADLTGLALAWDRALADPDLADRLRARAQALGAHEHSRGPERLAAMVRDDLLGLIHAAGLELGQLHDAGELLARAARQLHTDLLDGLETAAEALEPRVEAKRELPAIDEWQTFLALREQYLAAVGLGGLDLRRLAFQTVHGPLCSLAVWLWNERSERALGNAMFEWLLREAIIVDDAEAVRLQERNVRCGV